MVISKIIGTLFQNWLLERSRIFSIWLFGTEAASGVLIAAIIVVQGIPLLGLVFVWYASICAIQFFDWERKRALNKSELWEAPQFAKACALFYAVGYLVIGSGLLVIDFGSITVRIIGIVVFAFGLLQLYSTWKGHWPGDLV